MKIGILFGVIFIVLLTLFFIDPIAQPVSYHQFADQRSGWGIPNTFNVLTNLAFVVVGIVGLALTRHAKLYAYTFFIGLLLTGFGSAYYHWVPTNNTLVWDRYAISITLMAFFGFVIAMHLGERMVHLLFIPLLMLGLLSVLYWEYSESIGQGDLRFYGLVQFLPIILIPAIVVMFPTTNYRAAWIGWSITLYLLAKVTELFDGAIYEVVGISGHSLKHLLAAAAGLFFLVAVKSVQSNKESDHG